MKDSPTEKHSTNSLPVSVTAASNSDLIAALAPVSDDAESQPEIFERLNAILNFGFQQDLTPNERKALLAEYWRAVEGYPAWAIHRAIGSAQRATPNRRPTPGEIGIHCDRQVERIRAELRHRRAKADENAIEDAAPNRVTGEQAERIMQTLGFTAERLRAVRAAPSARTMDEAQAMASRPPRRHWTDGLPPDDPRMKALEAARSANPIIRQSRASGSETAPHAPAQGVSDGN